MIRNILVRILKEKYQHSQFYNWLVSVILGEFRWMKKLEQLSEVNSSRRRYWDWIKDCESDVRNFQEKVSHSDTITPYPKFQILRVIKNLDINFLIRSFHKLNYQIYDRWEHCFLFVGKLSREDLDILRNLLEKDQRVECVVFDEKIGPSDWIYGVMEENKFDYAVFLDPDGILAPHALVEFAKIFNENPEVDWIYCDEDCIDHKEKRHSPWFKPDWSPELLLSINYLAPAVIRKEIISNYLEHRQTEDRDKWVESPLYFLDIPSTKVHHCPKVLYHRMKTKKWFPSRHVVDHQHQKWVDSYLQKSGFKDARPILTADQELQISFTPKDATVSILIPSKDNVRLLQRCIDSILQRTSHSNYQLIVIDTCSELEESLRFYQSISEYPMVEVTKFESEFNYSQVNNFGAQIADGEYLLFLNDDIEVMKEKWLQELLGLAQIPGIGIVGARLNFPNGTIQHNGIILGLGGHAGHVFRGVKQALNNPYGSTGWYRNVFAVTGACMLVHREVYNEIGGFDEEYRLVYSDVDFCLKAFEHGYRVVVSPFTELIHHEGASRGRFMPIQDVTLAYERFLPYLHAGDPYYNPNLSYQKTYPRIGGSNEMCREERVQKILERMKHSSSFEKTGDR